MQQLQQQLHPRWVNCVKATTETEETIVPHYARAAAVEENRPEPEHLVSLILVMAANLPHCASLRIPPAQPAKRRTSWKTATQQTSRSAKIPLWEENGLNEAIQRCRGGGLREAIQRCDGGDLASLEENFYEYAQRIVHEGLAGGQDPN